MVPTAMIVAPVAVRVVRSGEAAASAEEDVDDEARCRVARMSAEIQIAKRKIIGM